MLYTIAETTRTPQGDGNSPEAAALPLPPETTYTPQGDGNMSAWFIFTRGIPETTHTPQGDGNKAWYTGFPVSLGTTYTPQGDDPLERRDPHEPANRTSDLRLSAP